MVMRNKDETQQFFAGAEGCLEHGEDAVQVCPTCGEEYCGRCSPGAFCPDCAMDGGDDDDDLFGGKAPGDEADDEDGDPMPDDLRRELDEDLDDDV